MVFHQVCSVFRGNFLRYFVHFVSPCVVNIEKIATRWPENVSTLVGSFCFGAKTGPSVLPSIGIELSD